MGQEIAVPAPKPLAEGLAALAAAGCAVVMVDGQLVPPSAPLPAAWSEVRLRSAVGMLTVRRRGEGLSVMVFGNAGPELVALQRQVAAALAR
jgi:hypothetical protein